MFSLEQLIELEGRRQKNSINLIASENYLPLEYMALTGNHFMNKYAEGYPNKRFYQGCELVDIVETECINQACLAFNVSFANVQPHSGSQANQAIFKALLKPGQRILSLDLKHGGHLSHGFKSTVTFDLYEVETYGVNSELILDYSDFAEKVANFRPNLVIVGFSAYVFDIDYAKIRSICGSNILILADISHTSGLIVGGQLNNPFPHVDIAMTTTHKSLYGPRGAVILWNNPEFTKSICRAVFPGIQGGPNVADICLKLKSFAFIQTQDYKLYAEQVVRNSRSFSSALRMANFKVFGSENHMCLVDLGLDSRAFVSKLDTDFHITTNYNFLSHNLGIPTGIRFGTYAMTSRGWKELEFEKLATLIGQIYREDFVDSTEVLQSLYEACINDEKFFC